MKKNKSNIQVDLHTLYKTTTITFMPVHLIDNSHKHANSENKSVETNFVTTSIQNDATVD